MEELEELREQSCLLDKSIFWLGIVGFGFILSVIATLRQREALSLTMEGDAPCAQVVGDVFPLRSAASVLYVVALTFFFCVTVAQGERVEAQGDAAALRSSRLNRWASLFVLAAAIVRLWDVNETQRRKNAGD